MTLRVPSQLKVLWFCDSGAVPTEPLCGLITSRRPDKRQEEEPRGFPEF